MFEKFEMVMKGDINLHYEKDLAMPLKRQDLVEWCKTSFDDLMRRLTFATGKHRWAEKTPAHVFHMQLIHEVYPNVRFIHIIRNGKDVVRSLQRMKWAPRKIKWSCTRWVESVLAGRSAATVLPIESYAEVRYEDLIAEPEREVRNICSFINEQYFPQMLAFHEAANNSWGIQSHPIETKPVNTYPELSLFERWVFTLIGGRLQRELNYD